jgi:hypothetical protein
MSESTDVASEVEAPAEPKAPDAKPEEAPAKAEEAPAKVEEAVAKPEEAPAKPEEAPAKAEEAPAKVEEACAIPEEAPAKPEEAPATTEDAPAKVEEAPAPPPPAAPSIQSVEPHHGPLGGVPIVIDGEGFAEGSVVHLDGEAVATIFESPTRLRVEMPARSAKGIVEIRVVNADGQSVTDEDGFLYDAPPTITGTQPACAPVQGGTVLTILGSNFVEGCGVRIDGELVPSAHAGRGRLEAVLKAHAAGEVDLVVENPDKQSTTLERALRYAEPPAIASVSPTQATTSGGIEVSVTGRFFEPGAAVILGDAPVEGARRESETELRFTAPPRRELGPVDLAVVNPTGLVHRIPLAFAYVKAAPRIASIAPDRGPNTGGTRLVLRGAELDEGCEVFICGIAATVTWRSREEIEVATPAVARDGLVDLRLVNRDDQAHTLEKAFRYDAPMAPPALASVSPKQGSQAGGLKAAVLGDDFAEGAIVRFGGVAAAVTFKSRKELEVVTPVYAGSGEVTVEVVNPDGASSALEAAFVFEARPAPAIAGITPNMGPTTGGTKIVIEGQNFTRDCAVYIGRENPKDTTWKSATEIHVVTAPRKAAGLCDVEVAAPGAGKAVMKNGFRFDAVPAPVITSVSPNAGAVAGGTEMSISGKNFIKESIVLVDGKPPKAVKLVNPTTLEFKTPPGEAGKMVDVIVRNPDGKEAVQKRAFLYDPRYR